MKTATVTADKTTLALFTDVPKDAHEVAIDHRKIVCKSCQRAGDNTVGFRLYEAPVLERVIAVCEGCGTANMIRRKLTL